MWDPAHPGSPNSVATEYPLLNQGLHRKKTTVGEDKRQMIDEGFQSYKNGLKGGYPRTAFPWLCGDSHTIDGRARMAEGCSKSRVSSTLLLAPHYGQYTVLSHRPLAT